MNDPMNIGFDNIKYLPLEIVKQLPIEKLVQNPLYAAYAESGWDQKGDYDNAGVWHDKYVHPQLTEQQQSNIEWSYEKWRFGNPKYIKAVYDNPDIAQKARQAIEQNDLYQHQQNKKMWEVEEAKKRVNQENEQFYLQNPDNPNFNQTEWDNQKRKRNRKILEEEELRRAQASSMFNYPKKYTYFGPTEIDPFIKAEGNKKLYPIDSWDPKQSGIAFDSGTINWYGEEIEKRFNPQTSLDGKSTKIFQFPKAKQQQNNFQPEMAFGYGGGNNSYKSRYGRKNWKKSTPFTQLARSRFNRTGPAGYRSYIRQQLKPATQFLNQYESLTQQKIPWISFVTQKPARTLHPFDYTNTFTADMTSGFIHESIFALNNLNNPIFPQANDNHEPQWVDIFASVYKMYTVYSVEVELEVQNLNNATPVKIGFGVDTTFLPNNQGKRIDEIPNVYPKSTLTGQVTNGRYIQKIVRNFDIMKELNKSGQADGEITNTLVAHNYDTVELNPAVGVAPLFSLPGGGYSALGYGAQNLSADNLYLHVYIDPIFQQGGFTLNSQFAFRLHMKFNTMWTGFRDEKPRN